ncbi:hypothetical protein J7643_00195 [bacterium]|nr:hypothetical protein [bacterium]
MKRALLAFVALGAAGCAWQDGAGFGTLHPVALSAAFSPSAGRLDAQGWLKTDNNMRVKLEALTLQVRALSFSTTTAASAGTGGTFDPANPPSGYSLCHNGHCHRSDGALVDYAEIQAEMNGGKAGETTVLSLPGAGATGLLAGTVALPLGAATPSAMLAKGTWTKAILDIAQLEATGSVQDPTPEARLGGQPRTFAFKLVPSPLSKRLTVEIDRSQPDAVKIQGALALSEKLLDQLDWKRLAALPGSIDLSADATASAQLAENFAQSTFTLDVTR